jgi:hypothetical protein
MFRPFILSLSQLKYPQSILYTQHFLPSELLLVSPLGTSTTVWPTVPDDDESAAVGRMSGSGHQSTQRKPLLVPLCPPQIPHNLIWAQTWATAWKVGNESPELRPVLNILGHFSAVWPTSRRSFLTEPLGPTLLTVLGGMEGGGVTR